ncbi:predicted protein [Histoplasma mississippiense (nom. inval.)]|uniref:predicted protein n=1 Tax=Ajellomyces capsulatus (strain NAm1 / WU24) TaxID=2059318 RepID=UPI000157C2DE|nr:predicted protein [Histoplasma mississippiense (nom. inval.)]EDN07653.1 predicted protein [Histoplasma mississippiense (nom. inval.)]
MESTEKPTKSNDTDDEASELSEMEEDEKAQDIDIEISEISIFSKPSIQQRSWKNTNPVEIKVFIGILLYMRARRPEAKNKDWWYKVEPLATKFHMACRKYYTPGSKISIDEIMVKCFGRSQHTYKMPNKPIPRGYKIFGLAEHGYLWSFSWSSRRQGIMSMFQFPMLTKTGSMVVNLVKRLPIISTPNTLNTMPNATPNIDSNITHNIGPNINPKRMLRRMPRLMKSLSHSWSHPIQFIWITTLHQFLYSKNYVNRVIERTRKCPGELSTNANIVRKAFEGQPQKKLKISLVIDDYNHHMNGVDLANQYWAAYTSHRVTYRTWLPILYWLIDSAAINAYQLQYLYMKQQGIPAKDLPSHISFHEKLYQELFEFTPRIHDNLPRE